MKILMIFGTRPEAIKMCPLALEIKKQPNIECKVCLSGQHRELTNQVMEVFGVTSDYNLDIMKTNQSLSDITSSVLSGLNSVLSSYNPDMVLVHGDTTTSFVAALAAFYAKIPIGHVEAGLRSNNIYSPYPEEMNRLLTDRLSSIHFAPTEKNKQNLYSENITDNVFVTGNTIVDAFKYTVCPNYTWAEDALNSISPSQKIILVTAHRRENWGAPLNEICNAIKSLAISYPNCTFVYPVHPNPIVKETVNTSLDKIRNIILIPPIGVLDMHNLLAKCHMVMTDSGGLQEEAPHFGIPVLVLRTETERPEAVEAGAVKVVGTSSSNIIKEAEKVLLNSELYAQMSHAINPYGDGHASERIVEIIKNSFLD